MFGDAFLEILLLITILIADSSQCVPPRTAPLFFYPDAPTPISLVQMHLFESEMGITGVYMPKFLAGSPPQKFEEFKQLLEKCAQLRDDQILSRFSEWLRAQSSLIQNKYREYDSASNETIPLFKQLRQQQIDEYSTKAHAIDSELVSLIVNPYLTASTKIKQVFAQLNALPDKQCDEIAKAWRQIRINYAKIVIAKAAGQKKPQQQKRALR